MKCPKCNTCLVVSERKGIEINHCPQCHGVWLERGEFNKIITNSDGAQSIIQGFRKNNDIEYKRGYNVPIIGPFEEYSNKMKRKKSMLDNLFDFCMR